MKFTFHRFAAATILACSLVIAPVWMTGCQSTLEQGGSYAPATTNAVTGEVLPTVAADKPFFVVDGAFYLAYSAIDAAFNFERDNRATLWALSPDIKHTLDKIRPDAVLARNSYIKAREGYIRNPTPAGLDTLNEILSKIQQLQSAATAVLPK